MSSEDLTLSFYQRMADDGLLCSMLSTYDGLPAIFTSEQIPEDVEDDAYYIVTPGYARPSPFTTDPLVGDRHIRNIEVYGPVDGSANRIDMIADRITEIFNWGTLTETGFDNFLSKAAKGIENGGAGVQGRLVQVNLYESTLSSSPVGFEDYEIPAEVPDGVITNFSTTREYRLGSLQVWINGYEQRPGVDFSQDSDLLGFTLLTGAPATGSHIWVKYRY